MRPAIKSARSLVALMGEYKRRIPAVILFGLILGLVDISGLGLLVQFIGKSLSDQAGILMIPWLSGQHAGLLLIVFFTARAVLGILSYWYINSVSGKVEASLQAELFMRYQQMAFGERLKRGEAEYVNVINVWVLQYTRYLLIPLARLLSDFIIGLMVILYLAYLNWMAFAFFLVLIGSVGLFYDRLLRLRGQTYGKRFRVLSSQVASNVQQCLEGYKEIRVLGLERYFQQKLKYDATEVSTLLAKANTISQSPRLIIEVVLALFVVICITFMDFEHTTASTPIMPLLAAFAVGGVRIISLASLASSAIFNLRLYHPVVDQLVADYAIRSVVPPAVDSICDEPRFKALKVDGLTFAYDPASLPIIKDLSFSISAGENMVILGTSGSGKTTLVDLLLGIIEPGSGSIEVIFDEAIGPAPNLVGIATYLSQTTFILNDTLRHNVAFGCHDGQVDDVRVIAALTKARLSQFANKESLDMMLGDRGGRISGGQRQRVALARALYLGRNVLILDEATNAIDLATEMEIIKDLLAIRPEITLITITHRPELAKMFPKRLDLSEGVLA